MTRRKPKPSRPALPAKPELPALPAPYSPIPPPLSADRQRLHFYKLLTVQNVVTVIVLLVSIIAAFNALRTRVSLNTQQIESLEKQQKAVWQRLQDVRR